MLKLRNNEATEQRVKLKSTLRKFYGHHHRYGFSGVGVSLILVFCVVFCTSLYIFCPFSFDQQHRNRNFYVARRCQIFLIL